MISFIATDSVGKWAEELFNKAPEGYSDEKLLAHLVEEVNELIEDPSDGYEMADIVLIVMHIAFRKNINLGVFMDKKFELCKNSEWYYDEGYGRMRRIKDGNENKENKD